jgi:nucleolar MIF4G domain-containing protein 1
MLMLPSCSLALHNLVMVMSHLYSCGLVRSDIMYSLLHKLRDRMSELDVDMVVSVLGSVGLQLRNEDPAAMKDFVVGVHARAAELGQQGINAL